MFVGAMLLYVSSFAYTASLAPLKIISSSSVNGCGGVSPPLLDSFPLPGLLGLSGFPLLLVAVLTWTPFSFGEVLVLSLSGLPGDVDGVGSGLGFCWRIEMFS